MLILDSQVSLGTLIDELYLKPTNLTHAQAAELCQLSEPEFSAIVRGELPMNHKRALAMSRGFNTHISFFQNYIPSKPED